MRPLPPKTKPCQLSAVRVAAHDAALHHRVGATKTGNHLSNRHSGHQGTGRAGHRDGNDGAEKNRGYKYQHGGLRTEHGKRTRRGGGGGRGGPRGGGGGGGGGGDAARE